MPGVVALQLSCRPSDGRSLRDRVAVRTVAVLAVAAASLLVPSLAIGHEIGTTKVIAILTPDHRYEIEVTTDADALLARLELAQRRPRTRATSTFEAQRAFDAVCDEVPHHLTVQFSDHISVPRSTCVVDPDDPANTDPFNVRGVVVTLRGDVPARATTLRWQYGLTGASYALVLASPGREAQTVWLEGDQKSPAIALGTVAAPSRAELARTYVLLGFTHIVPKGLDHILFVLGLFFLSRRLRPILLQVSAFTLAHSITLGLTLYGVIALSPRIVEPLIAVSIVYVAVENLWTSELKPWRVALVFAFGLLHGMGFAGILRELTLPPSEFLTGLVAFNVGVEAGQLAVILAAFACVGVWVRQSDVYRRVVVVPASIAIAAAGMFWTLQRLAA